MGRVAVRDIIKSLDRLLYINFVYVYLLDSRLSLLVFRLLTQLQFISPIPVSNTLRTAVHLVLFGFFISVVSHGLGIIYRKGFIIDFVGQATLPGRLHLMLIDCVITCLQLLLVFTAYAHGHEALLGSTGSQRPSQPTESHDATTETDNATTHQDEEQGEEGEEDGEEEPLFEDEEREDIGFREEYAVNLQWRSSLRNYLYADQGEDGLLQGIPSLSRRRLPV